MPKHNLNHSQNYSAKITRILENLKPNKPELNNAPILLLGPARTGKSLVAQKLKESHGFTVINLDKIRSSQPQILDTIHFRLAFLTDLLKIIPKGIIIEGDSLVGNSFISNKTLDNIALMPYFNLFMKMNKGLFVTLVNYDLPPSKKALAINNWRENNPCWTTNNNYTDKQILNLAERMLAYSKGIKEMSDFINNPCFQIGTSSDFNSEIETIAEKIFQLSI